MKRNFGAIFKNYSEDDHTVRLDTPAGSFTFPRNHNPDPVEMSIMLKTMGHDMTYGPVDPFDDMFGGNGFDDGFDDGFKNGFNNDF